MAYTSADLTNVEQAIIALASGTKIVRMTIGDKSFEYGQADISDLKKLRAEIHAELAESTIRPKFVLTQTGKGF